MNQYSAVAAALGDPPGTRTTDSPAYDDDGNTLALSLDSTDWTFTWDAENRLASAESGSRRIEYTYDYKGRRVERRVYTGTPGNWTLSIQERTLWHGWLPAAEFVCQGSTATLERSRPREHEPPQRLTVFQHGRLCWPAEAMVPPRKCGRHTKRTREILPARQRRQPKAAM